MRTETELWRLAELRNRAADALTHYKASVNGQVTAIPDARTIRYYGTLGLLDKPAEMRGRTAFYGRRHLLQLVAIKRLQAQGRKLAEIQQELSGCGDAELEELAKVPSFSGPARDTAAPSAKQRRSEAFWSAPVTATTNEAGLVPTAELELSVKHQLSLELTPGICVVVDTRKTPSDEDLAALSKAATSLIEALRTCGLTS